jgi:hypothetical protein
MVFVSLLFYERVFMNSFFDLLLFGIIIGLITAIVTIYVTKKQVEDRGFDFTEDAIGTHHTRTYEVKLPYHEAYDICIHYIQSIPNVIIETENRAIGKIVAKTKLHMKNGKSLIEISIQRIGSDRAKIAISSRTLRRIVMYDNGFNLQNVESIKTSLYDVIVPRPQVV